MVGQRVRARVEVDRVGDAGERGVVMAAALLAHHLLLADGPRPSSWHVRVHVRVRVRVQVRVQVRERVRVRVRVRVQVRVREHVPA